MATGAMTVNGRGGLATRGRATYLKYVQILLACQLHVLSYVFRLSKQLLYCTDLFTLSRSVIARPLSTRSYTFCTVHVGEEHWPGSDRN